MLPKIDVVPRPVDDDPEYHAVILTIGAQTFEVGSGPGFENEEQARWFAEQLATALDRLERPAGLTGATVVQQM